MKDLVTAAILAAGLGSGAALAAEEEDVSGERMLEQLDADDDGVISQEEAQASPQLSDKFDQADADGDGELGLSEVERAMTGGEGGPGGPPGDGGSGAGGGSGTAAGGAN